MAISEPVDFIEGSKYEEWQKTMKEEIEMIEKNQTWELTTKPKGKNVIGVKWVYRTKVNPDGSIFKHKVKLVVKGYAWME